MDGTFWGVNLTRRKRQADENARPVMEKFIADLRNNRPIIEYDFDIDSITKLKYRVERLAENANTLAKKIQPDWAIPILIESLSRLYYGDMREYIEYGPIFKRAVAHVWKASFANASPSIYDASRKNVDSLVSLLKICYTIEVVNGLGPLFYICEDFKLSIINGYVKFDDRFDDEVKQFKYHISGRGRRLRVAEDSDLVMHSPEYLVAIQAVLDGNSPSNIELFKGTFYEKIPGIETENCLEFWQTLYFRSQMFFICQISGCSDTLNTNVFLFPTFTTEIPFNYCTQDIVTNTFWKPDWVKHKETFDYSRMIVERPILRMSEYGDFATSAVLIGDSINLYIEDSILGYSSRKDRAKLPDEVFKRAFSEPFEEEIIDEMVNRGFDAGHVSEKGIWNKKWLDGDIIEEDNIDLRFDSTKLFGEVDAFVLCPGGDNAILIECKVLNDYRDLRSFENLFGKLKNDAEGFRDKLNKKAEWLEKAMESKYGKKVKILKVLLTDIKMPVFDNSKGVYLTYREQLLDFIDELLFHQEN